MTGFRIISVATGEERMFHLFKDSVEKRGIPLYILGKDQEWKGFAWRFDLILEHLDSCPDDEIVFVADSYDSLVLLDEDEIVRRFKSFNHDKVFCLEGRPEDWDILSRHYNYRVFGAPPVVNGGAYVGYAKALKEFIRSLEYSDSTDDQRLLTAEYKKRDRDDMVLDWDGSLFFTYSLAKRVDRTHLHDAAVISFPGGNDIDTLIEQAGYPGYHTPTSVIIKMDLEKAFFHYGIYCWREILLGFSIFVYLIVFCRRHRASRRKNNKSPKECA